MSENKTGKYFKYAIGEIILVVIGILIALGINNWNEDRKLKKEERLALLNLKEDFEQNLTSIENLIALTSNEIDAGLKVLEHTGKNFDSTNKFNLDSMLVSIGNHQLYFSQNGFLNDLINSGKIGIIEKDSLRVLLSSWGQTTEELYRKEQSALHHITSFIDYIKKNGSWVKIDNLYPQMELNFPKSGFDIDNKKMLKSIEFENLVDEVINRKAGNRKRQRKVKELNSEILSLIRIELEKK
jgi:hypothetical protein